MSSLRYNLDGSPDTSFGSGGSVILGSQAIGFYGGGLAIQPDGKIIEAGTSKNSQGLEVGAVARFDVNGSLDSTFNPSGPTPGVVVIAGTTGGGFSSGVIQPDGKIVAAGLIGEDSPGQTLLTRLNSDGSLDSTFGTNGVVLDTLAGNAIAKDVALQSDGKIVTDGSAYINSSVPSGDDFAIIRFLGDPPASGPACVTAAPTSTISSSVLDSRIAPLVLDEPSFLDTIVLGKRRHATSLSHLT